MSARRITLLAVAASLLAACGAAEPGSTVGAPAGDAAATIVRGEALVEQGAFEEAAAVFEKVLAGDPTNAKGHYYLGLCRENLGDATGAIKQYREAVGHDPNLAEAHNNLGNLLLAGGDPRAAEAELATYLELRPDESGAHYNYALALEELGQPKRAREQYEKAIELDPEDPAPLIGVGDLDRQAGKLEDALDLYRRARALDAEDPLPLLREGQALLELKRAGEAASVLTGLADLPAADPTMLTTAGILLGRHGKPDGAIALYRAAVERDDGFALAHFKLANALGREGRFGEAASHFERFLELAPDTPEAAAAEKGLAACREQLDK